MRRQGGGHIVSIASTAAKRAWANASAYCASKAGLAAFTHALGVEGRPFHIRTTVIVPGGMRTRFFDRFAEPPDPATLNEPANVARAILFALAQPPGSVVQEILVTPPTESSWP
jgi:NAD(P)-dependent dehydrogenase (short-subunit alcohol dehydrogenase family)